MGKGKAWTAREIKLLRSGYDDPDLLVEDIVDVLGRSAQSVAQKASHLGLKKAHHEKPEEQ